VALEAIGAAADNYAANVLPIIRQIRKADATALHRSRTLHVCGHCPGRGSRSGTCSRGPILARQVSSLFAQDRRHVVVTRPIGRNVEKLKDLLETAIAAAVC
jgi:hypothetical protein